MIYYLLHFVNEDWVKYDLTNNFVLFRNIKTTLKKKKKIISA